MKFSEHWLRMLADPPIGGDALADALTMAGIEVEGRVPVAPPFSGVVVGKVLAVERHPNAERLTICRVDVGQDAPVSVVCGAPNVAAGVVAPYAQSGAMLPGGLNIGRAVMRGVESQGMLCSASELGLSDDASGLLLLDPDAPIGVDLRRVLDLDDAVLEVKLTPNRADCLSILGLAREVAAITGVPLAQPPLEAAPARGSGRRGVRIEDPLACPRFCGRVIEGIDATAPTPAWIRQRIERSGIRSISAIVDVTNYVMLELGQPLHAYDDALLDGVVVVRFARPGEQLRLLNGQTLDLDPDLLLVADEKKPLGLAGIMGGEHSGISTGTKMVFLEGALWNPAVIQGKARRLGFATDAGFRFERGVDFAIGPAAVERATQLIIDVCGGRAGALIDVRGTLPRRDPVRVRSTRATRLLGVAIAPETIAAIFARLGLAAKREGSDFIVTPPSYRFDLTIEEDFIEEVARLYGYDNIPTRPVRHTQAMLPAPESVRSATGLRNRLVDRDYHEVITFSFVSSDTERLLNADSAPISVLNPIASNLDVMRTTLLGGLLEVLRTNVNRKLDRVRVFEAGRCFVRDGEHYNQSLRIGGLAFGSALPEHWDGGMREIDFFDVKGDVEALAAPLAVTTQAATHTALHPGRSARVLIAGKAAGWIGELHPRLVRAYELTKAPVVFEIDQEAIERTGLPVARPVPRFPTVRRDLAVVVDDGVSVQSLLDALKTVRPPHVERIAVFDVYRGPGVGPGKKSLAILVLMQDTARTLTDAEIDATVADLLRELQNRFKATLRQ
ncbi:MAG: phenylalanine--tRNA ligase subunit beta [Betaproteobacteria bacterium]